MKRYWPWLLLLAGCASISVQQARTVILGTNLVDLLACAGVPDKVQRLSADELLLQYDRPAENAALFSLKVLTDLDVAMGRSGGCHAHFRVLRDGTVSGVSFSGTTFSFSGPQSDCSPLIAECTDHPDQTELPPGYDAFAILLPDKGVKP